MKRCDLERALKEVSEELRTNFRGCMRRYWRMMGGKKQYMARRVDSAPDDEVKKSGERDEQDTQGKGEQGKVGKGGETVESKKKQEREGKQKK
jgi:hypothetical protein